MKPRLQRNLVLLFLGSSAIPLTLVTAVGYLGATRSIERLMLRQTNFSSREIERRFDRELQRLRDRFLFMTLGVSQKQLQEDPIRSRRDETVDPRIDELLLPGKYDGLFSGLVILDTANRPRYRIDYRGGLVTTMSGSRYFLQTDRFSPADRRGSELMPGLERGRVDSLFSDPRLGMMEIRLVAPLYHEGERTGAILADVDAASLMESIVEGISLGKDAFHIVTDSRSDVVLSHPDPAKRNQLISMALPGLSDVSLSGDDESGRRFHDERGGLWLLSSRALPDTPWVASVATPLGIYLAPINRVGSIGLVLVVLILAGATAMIVLSTKRFRHSLTSLSRAAQRFSYGDLDNRVEVRSRDEMGALADTFNRMASQLQGLIRQREESARFDSFHRLSAAVTHDLKGSLTGLSLLLENMEKHLDKPDFLRDSATTIRSAVERMRRATGKLSQSSSQWSRRSEPIRLAPLLEKLMKEAALTAHPELRTETDLDPQAEIRGDPEEIEGSF